MEARLGAFDIGHPNRSMRPLGPACLAFTGDARLAAMVLYDHARDWQEDLATGRWNAFVAMSSSDPQTPEHREGNRASVLAAMLGRGLQARYFARIRARLERAIAAADRLELTALAAYLSGLMATTDREVAVLDARHRRLGTMAASLVFGSVASLDDGGSQARPAAAGPRLWSGGSARAKEGGAA